MKLFLMACLVSGFSLLQVTASQNQNTLEQRRKALAQAEYERAEAQRRANLQAQATLTFARLSNRPVNPAHVPFNTSHSIQGQISSYNFNKR